MIPRLFFDELDSSLHDRDSFASGKNALDDFLKTKAARHMKAGISRTLVLSESAPQASDKSRICAFFTIAPGSITRNNLPEQLAKRLPHYPVPVFLIAQLAVHRDLQGQGLGKITLIKALEKLAAIHQQMHAHAVIVDCIDEEAAGFYRQFGFENLCQYQGRNRMFLPMKTVLKLFEN
jgi:GNAT superfamily N-acetyltransferase